MKTHSIAAAGVLSLASSFAALPAGAAPFLLMHSFSDDGNPRSGGAQPIGGMVIGQDGNRYGTTSSGGENGKGTVYRMTFTGRVDTVHSFSGGDGEAPQGELTVGPDGSLYGVTAYGGRCGVCGTVFRIAPDGRFSVVHRFRYGSQGGTPNGGLLLASDGQLYGTTYRGGYRGVGTLYRFTPAGEFQLVHTFGSRTGDADTPGAGVTQGPDGKLYGTSARGGSASLGTVYRVNDDGSLQVLKSFNDTDRGGYNPDTAVAFGSDGTLYGLASAGGRYNAGTMYRILADGTFQRLHEFGDASGTRPTSLIKGGDENFYGTTFSGGANGAGTAFIYTLDGDLFVLHDFSGSDGDAPWGRLVQAGDGFYYGTTYGGGANGSGVTYRLGSWEP